MVLRASDDWTGCRTSAAHTQPTHVPPTPSPPNPCAPPQENAGGGPCMYAVAERLREWLQAHNEPAGSGSAYEEMLKRQKKAAEGDKGESGVEREGVVVCATASDGRSPNHVAPIVSCLNLPQLALRRAPLRTRATTTLPSSARWSCPRQRRTRRCGGE